MTSSFLTVFGLWEGTSMEGTNNGKLPILLLNLGICNSPVCYQFAGLVLYKQEEFTPRQSFFTRTLQKEVRFN